MKKISKPSLKINAFVVVIFAIIILSGVLYFLNRQTEKSAENRSEELELKSKTDSDRTLNILIDDDAIMGKKNAPIIIVEFGEFMCPFCGQVHREVEPLWRKEYIETGKTLYVFRDFMNSKHPQAYPAAMANQCAAAQNKQWEMYDLLFENAYAKDSWTKYQDEKLLLDIFGKYAKQIRINVKKFNACMLNQTYADEIWNDMNTALSLRVYGTPTIFIGNDKTGFAKIRGAQPYSVYKQIIDEKLNSS